MDKKMFCYQCEQTVGCTGCTGNAGVCGKKAGTAKLQLDVLCQWLVSKLRMFQVYAGRRGYCRMALYL